ncbi:MAG: DUF3244 domain-containing protein [Bacteroidaceae bacterium]|nr:DUF3244 domain-containing protein [Bacteroidaceae bacterium]
MNKKSLVLFLMLLIANCSIIHGMSPSSDDKKKEDIVLDEKKSWDNSDLPRSLDRLVWTCYYENGSVYLNVPFEMDSVTLTVTNTTTGEVWTLRQEFVLGWISLPTSEVQGNYMVEVKTKHHGEYMGFYNL